MKKIAFFGGTFDPVHCGHIVIGKTLLKEFSLDRFVFLPAFHAPHKPERKPTSALHRYAMLCLATAGEEKMLVSTIELDKREKRYTIDTLADLEREYPDTERFFVMGADSWSDIRTWRDWENVLLAVNHIVVARPGYDIRTDHVTEKVRGRVVDLREGNHKDNSLPQGEPMIYFTDSVKFDVSATALRDDLSDGDLERRDDVPQEVAKYIEKYELYI